MKIGVDLSIDSGKKVGSPDIDAPLFLSAEIGSVNSQTLVVTFDQNISASNYATGVIIKVNSETQTIESATRQSNHAVVHYVIPDSFFVNTDTVTWEYTGGNIIAEDNGTALANVTAQTVTNNEEIMKAIVTLTDAQIKALPTTAIDIVPAPGAGKVNQFIVGIVEIDTTAGAYTNVNAAAQIQFQLAPTGVATPITPGAPLNGFLDLAGTAFNSMLQDPTNAGFGNAFLADVPGSFENLSIGAWIGNGGAGNFTGGNAANTLKVIVFYSVIDL